MFVVRKKADEFIWALLQLLISPHFHLNNSDIVVFFLMFKMQLSIISNVLDVEFKWEY